MTGPSVWPDRASFVITVYQRANGYNYEAVKIFIASLPRARPESRCYLLHMQQINLTPVRWSVGTPGVGPFFRNRWGWLWRVSLLHHS